MIRVLHVVGKMHYGGMETFIMNVYRHIDREKVQFDFLVHYEEPGEYDEEIRSLGGKIYVMPKTVPQNYFIYKKALKKFFSEHQEYKIIHGHLHSVAFLYHHVAKQTGNRVCITHSHASGFDKGIKGYFRYILSLLAQKYTDVYFGCSPEACNEFFPNAIRHNKKMTVIKNGIASEKYIYSDSVRDKIRQELNIENDLVIGHIGRFADVKNHAFLLKIFAEILKIRHDSKLVLIGQGPLEEKIRALADDLSVSGNITFLGGRSDIPQLLQGMDIFVLPSLYEGLGIALVEAQAAGLKCFASTAVSKEAEVTDLLTYLDLSQPPEYWAEKIVSAVPYCRENKSRDIIDSGFDINETAALLEEFYLNC